MVNWLTMQIKRDNLSPTSIKLTVTADQAAIDTIKENVLGRLAADVKMSGFRQGKAPAKLVEKQVDPATLQTEFLNEAINELYVQAVREGSLKVVKEPSVTVTKFVPYTALEFTAEVDAVGDMKVANYKTIKLTAKKPVVTPKEINEVIDNIALRSATREDVKRPARLGDEVVLDFKGVDAATKELIEGAEGKEYPLTLGSKSFIPGFEEALVGLKAGASKTFDITFPDDYNVASLRKRKVSFDITLLKVSQLKKPKIDDNFAQQVGPFKSVAELKADVKKQLMAEKQTAADQELDNELLQKLADKSDVPIPDSLVEDEITRLEDEERRNVSYRGQTWQEHLEQEGVSEEEHRLRQKPMAITRIKTGLILGEIADKEKISVNDDELKAKLSDLKAQYTDQSMQAELDKPENQRDIHSRMMIEKTVLRLRNIATSKPSK